VSLRERAEAASKAGFTGLSLFVSDYRDARTSGASDAELRRMLSDLGLRIADVDPLLDWIPGKAPVHDPPQEDTAFAAAGEDEFYGVADANAACFTDEPLQTSAIADAFAALCARAARHDLLVHLEFMPFGPIASLEKALAVVEAAGAPNGGVMLDTWHWMRTGADLDALRAAPGERILGLQINDAPTEPAADLVEETLAARLLPGEGECGVEGVLRTLRRAGCAAPVEVEVFSSALAALPMREAAQRSGDAARRVLARAAHG
jgi:sugar phosphate isomerase/epimerase